jgi:2-haloacid dehalogenase
MELNRRQFVNLATGSVATCLLGAIVPAVNNSVPRIKAIAFDGFTTFDPRSVSALAEQLFAGRGPKFSNLWRTRQFEYTG